MNPAMSPKPWRAKLAETSPGVYSGEDLDEMERRPGAIHYGVPVEILPSVVLAAGTAFSKPWCWWSTHPESDLFYEHLGRTPWGDWTPPVGSGTSPW